MSIEGLFQAFRAGTLHFFEIAFASKDRGIYESRLNDMVVLRVANESTQSYIRQDWR